MASPIYDHHHAVQFYGDESHLYDTVASFFGQGFLDGQPALMIATRAHATAIIARLQDRMIDVRRAERLGDLVVIDAGVILGEFMVGDLPDPAKFDRTFGPLIAHMTQRRARQTSVRAYGEMVDVLWRQGRRDAALQVEELWNRLARRHGFALLCGYAMDHFLNETTLFEDVCRQHTHVMPGQPAH